MFTLARPVWIAGCAYTLNCGAVFETEIPAAQSCALLRISAFTFYRLYVNGRFAAFGPARAAEGYARIDEISLADLSAPEQVLHLRMEVAGYACRSLSTAYQPSFFCAEVVSDDGTVLAASGVGDLPYTFSCRLLTERVRNVERYSQQRHFSEIWDLAAGTGTPCETARITSPPQFLPRRAPYPGYEAIRLTTTSGSGTFVQDDSLPYRENCYSFAGSDYWGQFSREEIADENRPYRWIQRQALHPETQSCALPLTLSENRYALFAFDMLHCGFLTLKGIALSDCEIVIGYTEYCEDNTFAFSPMNVQNVIVYRIPAGIRVSLQSFEPYTVRNAIVMLRCGTMTLESFGVVTFAHAMEGAYRPALPTPSLQAIYNAALRTFAHNAVDLYSDCPSRERAGWLCDSYFTGAVEYFLFGKTPVEDAFLENYRLYKENPHIPAGMLPMCYPADSGHLEDQPYIPQWCMWYVLEVREYLLQRNPTADKEAFRDSVMGIIGFLAQYENDCGLLEDLPGWNFVEWSSANSWTKNVNYPTNFLYAEVLRAAHALYGCDGFPEKADAVAAAAIAGSFDGTLFCDHAVRQDGVLHRLSDTSEAGQYYALLFGGIDIDAPEYAVLKMYVTQGFPSQEDFAGKGRSFVCVNAFIGLYLRIKTLLSLGYYQLLLDALDDFFGGMVAKTNTLWEYRQERGSYDHGFASYAAPAILAALQGLGYTIPEKKGESS